MLWNKNRRQGPKTAGYRRKPAAISNPALYTVEPLLNNVHFVQYEYIQYEDIGQQCILETACISPECTNVSNVFPDLYIFSES
jgi:hypothetical protein